ncbi:hypothetical protein H6F86_23460 [Phormidium sp. FACHB-592]|uniref:Uncharacterized protein n=1 Tax=Stenomitos frigidus AS-A4 TaxID=2933935 RepID=A0ABV0KTA3_9CYAN|nr:hypothetical protein [Phormidium sp. FACHB-592]MBD2076790.1 hypothetical protein [Phormidium sp. FACHB-592]
MFKLSHRLMGWVGKSVETDPNEDGTAKITALNPCFAAVTRLSTRHRFTFAVHGSSSLRKPHACGIASVAR